MIVTDTNRSTFVVGDPPEDDVPVVRTFNLRTDDVVLTSLDVTDALGFVPAEAGGTVTISDVAGLQDSLDAKQATGDYATNTALTAGLATKQPVGSYLTGIDSAMVTTALGYTPTSVTGLTGIRTVADFKTGLSLVKADVGLGSVDNTADAAKNVLSATKLTTARTINGQSFDGTANITINAVDSTPRLASSAVSAFGLTLIDDADAAAARATLNAVGGATGTITGRFENTGAGAPAGAAGSGVEVAKELVLSYNRTTSAFAPITVMGSEITFSISGVSKFVMGTGGDAAFVGSVSALNLAGINSGDEWAPNFTAAGSVYLPATVAMTVSQGNAKIGTGTITFEKSTAAAPGTFSATTLPATLEAGAWLKVTAASVTGFVATHLRRTV